MSRLRKLMIFKLLRSSKIPKPPKDLSEEQRIWNELEAEKNKGTGTWEGIRTDWRN
jgi:hypothetical protein